MKFGIQKIKIQYVRFWQELKSSSYVPIVSYETVKIYVLWPINNTIKVFGWILFVDRRTFSVYFTTIRLRLLYGFGIIWHRNQILRNRRFVKAPVLYIYSVLVVLLSFWCLAKPTPFTSTVFQMNNVHETVTGVMFSILLQYLRSTCAVYVL
jgi:hypothetical protein